MRLSALTRHDGEVEQEQQSKRGFFHLVSHRKHRLLRRLATDNAHTPDMELGHWVTGSMGHLGHLSRQGHRVIILIRCETRVFPLFEKNAQNAKRTLEMLK